MKKIMQMKQTYFLKMKKLTNNKWHHIKEESAYIIISFLQQNLSASHKTVLLLRAASDII